MAERLEFVLVQIPPFDSISYLVARRFPGLNGKETLLRSIKKREQQAAVERARSASAINLGSFPKSASSHIGNQNSILLNFAPSKKLSR